MVKKCLGAGTDFHVAAAARLLDDAWRDLERMPPTCYGGIQMSARAFAAAERAQGHLRAIEDRSGRAVNTELYVSANRASKAAWKAVTFYANVCKAPYAETRKNPLASRRRRS